MDLALGTDDDLVIVNNELTVVTDLGDEVAQRLRIRLRFFKGEWFLDLREGIPYFQTILEKGASDKVIRAIFAQVISTTPGIAKLDTLEIERDGATRLLTLRFTATLDDGRVFTSADFGDAFLVRF